MSAQDETKTSCKNGLYDSCPCCVSFSIYAEMCSRACKAVSQLFQHKREIVELLQSLAAFKLCNDLMCCAHLPSSYMMQPQLNSWNIPLWNFLSANLHPMCASPQQICMLPRGSSTCQSLIQCTHHLPCCLTPGYCSLIIFVQFVIYHQPCRKDVRIKLRGVAMW